MDFLIINPIILINVIIRMVYLVWKQDLGSARALLLRKKIEDMKLLITVYPQRELKMTNQTLLRWPTKVKYLNKH